MNPLREALKKYMSDWYSGQVASERDIDQLIAIFREHTEFKPLPGGLREWEDEQLARELGELIGQCVKVRAHEPLTIDPAPLARWVRLRVDRDQAFNRWLGAKPTPTHPVPVWLILGDGERPYVQTCAPSPERYESLKAQGYRVYRAEVSVPEKVDDGVIDSTKAEVE